MRTYPTKTANKNVPANSFLLVETSAMSGEIVTTYYSDSNGALWKVVDWKGCKPEPAYPFEICRLTAEPISIIYSRVSNHFGTSFIEMVKDNVLN